MVQRFHNVEHVPLVQNANPGLAVVCLAPVPPLHTIKGRHTKNIFLVV